MSEQRDYADLVRHAPVGIFRSTRDGRITHANDAVVDLLGYGSEEEILALDLAQDVYASAADRKSLIREQSGDEYRDVVVGWVRADGREIRVRITGRPIRDADGRAVAFENFVEDVTEEQKARSALDRVLRSSGAILIRLEVGEESVRPVWVSASVQELLGYTTEEALDPEWWITGLHPDDRDESVHAVSRALEEDAVSFEYRFRHKDGGFHWFREELHVVRDETGALMELVGVGVDITALKERERELRLSESRYRTLTEAAPDGILTLDLDGRITYANEAALEIFGYRSDDLLGESFLLLFPERFRGPNRRAFRAMLEVDEARSLPARSLLGRRSDGTEFPGEVAFAVAPRREQLAVTAIVRDVTERVELQAEHSLMRLGHLGGATDDGQRIIPVCSKCKSIRDEEGEWQPMEEFVRERAPVEFSHGLCGVCVEELYGDLGIAD